MLKCHRGFHLQKYSQPKGTSASNVPRGRGWNGAAGAAKAVPCAAMPCSGPAPLSQPVGQHAGHGRGPAPFPTAAKPQCHTSKRHRHSTRPRGTARRMPSPCRTPQPCASALNFGCMCASTAFSYNFSLRHPITSFLFTVIIVIFPIRTAAAAAARAAVGLWLARGCACSPARAVRAGALPPAKPSLRRRVCH